MLSKQEAPMKQSFVFSFLCKSCLTKSLEDAGFRQASVDVGFQVLADYFGAVVDESGLYKKIDSFAHHASEAAKMIPLQDWDKYKEVTLVKYIGRQGSSRKLYHAVNEQQLTDDERNQYVLLSTFTAEQLESMWIGADVRQNISATLIGSVTRPILVIWTVILSLMGIALYTLKDFVKSLKIRWINFLDKIDAYDNRTIHQKTIILIIVFVVFDWLSKFLVWYFTDSILDNTDIILNASEEGLNPEDKTGIVDPILRELSVFILLAQVTILFLTGNFDVSPIYHVISPVGPILGAIASIIYFFNVFLKLEHKDNTPFLKLLKIWAFAFYFGGVFGNTLNALMNGLINYFNTIRVLDWIHVSFSDGDGFTSNLADLFIGLSVDLAIVYFFIRRLQAPVLYLKIEYYLKKLRLKKISGGSLIPTIHAGYVNGYRPPILTYDLILSPHGRTDNNVRHVFHGHTDNEHSLLNEAGRNDAHEMALKLWELIGDDFSQNPDNYVFIRSPLRSTDQTAQAFVRLVRKKLGRNISVPVIVDPGLIKINLGHWDGMTEDHLIEFSDVEFGKALQYRYSGNVVVRSNKNGAEHFLQFLYRVKRWLTGKNKRFVGKKVIAFIDGTFTNAVEIIMQTDGAPVEDGVILHNKYEPVRDGPTIIRWNHQGFVHLALLAVIAMSAFLFVGLGQIYWDYWMLAWERVIHYDPLWWIGYMFIAGTITHGGKQIWR